MLQTVIGRSGTGKLHYVLGRLEQLLNDGFDKSIVLIVPEQASFESERFLLSKLGPDRAERVQVLSFTRLADTIFAQCGEPRGKRLDDSARLLLLSHAMAQVADHLELYREQATRTDCLAQMAAMVSDCKRAAVSGEMLGAVAEQLSGGVLPQKLRECRLILEAYNALLATGYVDPLDDLAAATERLVEHPLFAGAQIFVDSFSGFSACELACLEELMKQAQAMTVTLCTDTLETGADESGLFDHPILTASRLKDMAARHHIPVAKTVILTENRRAINPHLAVLERNLFAAEPETVEEETDAVTVMNCRDIWQESEAAARTVRRLVRDGYRYRDIAVCARNLDAYDGILDSAFARLDIPLFRDESDDIMSDPLITLVQAVLQILCGRADTDLLLTMAKTGLLGLCTSSCSALENYVFMWRIRYSAWDQDWGWNPEGMTIRENTDSEKRLRYLNRLRRRIITPIKQLSFDVHGSVTGLAFSEAVYRYLRKAQVDRMVSFFAAAHQKAGRNAQARRWMRVWELLMDQLDKVATLFRNTEMPRERFAELLTVALQTVEFGSIPQTIDTVQVGNPDRMRFSHPKAVLLLGVNEGVFPAAPTQTGLFSEPEHRKLAEFGLELTDSFDLQFSQERYYAYTAIAAPSEYVYVSHVRIGSSGEKAYPSAVIQSIETIFPQLTQQTADTEPYPENNRDAFALFASEHANDTPRTVSLERVLEEQPTYAARMNALRRTAAHAPFAFRDADNAKLFFGKNMWLSPSKMNRFHECRFAYFCEYGLRISRRETAELDHLQFGNVTHYVMEHLLPQYVQEGVEHLRKAQVVDDVKRTIAQYVDEVFGGTADKPARFSYLLTRLAATGTSMMWQVVQELRQSRFVPIDYELKIGGYDDDKPHVDPITMRLPDGSSVRLHGTVDRVDTCEIDGVSYVRIVDYKTGDKKFRLADVAAGLNMQMLVYLFSICQNGEARYGTVSPAGVLYLPVTLPYLECDRDIDDNTANAEQIKQLKMNGLLLDDPAVLSAMEPDLAGLFIPAKLTAKGNWDSYSTLASMEEFGLIQRKIEKILLDMARTLHSGDVAAVPTDTGRLPCEYCAYRAICGREADDPVRAVLTANNAEILARWQAETEVSADG